MRRFMIFPAVALMLMSLFTACERHRNNPGWDYFPDMFYSQAYETYAPNPNFADGTTMRTPAEGTVPRDFVPFQYTTDPEDRIRAGRELRNPLGINEMVIARGKHEYLTFCVGCHGVKGDGNGYLHASGLYIAVPRSLVAEEARNLKDGEIYHTITLGFGSMGAHGSQIRPDDRWSVIAYIRNVLQAEAPADTTTQK